MTANKPMTGEQLDELMTVAVNMQRDSEKAGDRPTAMFAYAVQVAVLELRKIRDDALALAAENAGLKKFITKECHVAHVEPETFYEEEITRYVNADGYEPETPATDAFLAEVRANARNELVDELEARFTELSKTSPVPELRSGAAGAAGFVSTFRKGVQS
ncbi:hypothetical protein NOX27_06825 [Enterobacter kobei]|uniref:hypothetical protein n=1 Tax=Enterobacter cloacae complex TaxID=354276 RepID=UPI000796E086|nr:hypothetical protein [Enterobacter kobei]MCK7322983.1 hypothetical protein [Enterobacter kobei]MCQ4356065.1 hypothetical protein [Enterobacter kobei]MEA3824319.1 hypothetical protein [Enterobacter kobei]MEA4242636.1 hypothetical protein [Enterobacter kobei]CZW54933.1 Uncharacterised protein [Enterobacter kobei]